ncbi:alcohol dehydrogenase [Gluconacetobacter aggeris]|uniref:Alcohol dehydrogenase n=1 Tax=Gluconacetobacter aggeris TaxID=1286186 RepID=A0A7W4IPN6_9PROT|nr:alcohol dehydrogenase [Gluconacetobacter aggeris]MBB2166780.1 alcohol dehydrogenase [Gluconacetobacter aggeris]
MIRFSLRAVAILAAAIGFATQSLSVRAAHAEDRAPIVNDFAPVTAAAVGAITPVNLAGVLNYCIETNLVSHQDGDAVQTSLNAKTHAVPPGQTGHVDYAVGSAGQFIVGNTISTITRLDASGQAKTCSAVLARAKSAI